MTSRRSPAGSRYSTRSTNCVTPIKTRTSRSSSTSCFARATVLRTIGCGPTCPTSSCPSSTRWCSRGCAPPSRSSPGQTARPQRSSTAPGRRCSSRWRKVAQTLEGTPTSPTRASSPPSSPSGHHYVTGQPTRATPSLAAAHRPSCNRRCLSTSTNTTIPSATAASSSGASTAPGPSMSTLGWSTTTTLGTTSVRPPAR